MGTRLVHTQNSAHVSMAGTVYSRGFGKVSWTPHRLGAAFSCLHIVTLKSTALGNAGMVSFYALSVQFSVLVSCHVIVNQEISFTKSSKSGSNGPSLDASWHI